MKRTLPILLLATASSLASPTSRADDFDLYLFGTDGGHTSLDYANLRSLSFAQTRDSETRTYVNRMTALRADGTSSVYDLARYAAIRFERTAVGIAAPASDGAGSPSLAFDGERLRARRAGQLALFRPDGRLVEVRPVGEGEAYPVGHLAAGTYIARLGGQSMKILVK